MNRTLKNCSLIKAALRAGEGKPDQRNEKCMGYQRSEIDDEPCSTCKRCKLQESYTDDGEMEGLPWKD